MELRYALTGSTVVLGQVRTKLVDLIADLTSATPLTELPKKERVDAAVNERIGDVYNTVISKADGPVAIGRQAGASTDGLAVSDALQLLAAARQAAEDTHAEHSAAVVQAVDDLIATLGRDEPDTGEVVKKVGFLRAAAQKVGVVAVTAATTTAAETITELAVNGAFH
jgi:hypothetical protein